MHQDNVVHHATAWAGRETHTAMRAVAPTVAGCAAMALAAQVRIPVPGTDVPMTLQLLAMLLIGFALRPGVAVGAMVLYVVCGAAGLPVFAGPVGLAGGTAGFILGFAPAVWIVSRAARWRQPTSTVRLLSAGLMGTAVLFAIGVAWRFVFFRAGAAGEASGPAAIATGLAPFAGKALVELALAVAVAKCMGMLARRGGPASGTVGGVHGE